MFSLMFAYHFRYPWDNDTFLPYLMTLTIRVSQSCLYFMIVYSQVGLLVGFSFYLKCFAEDIRHQLKKSENKCELILKKEFTKIVEFHYAMVR